MIRPQHFPLDLIRAALRMKLHDMGGGHRGPIIGVLFSRKYGKPMLQFCSRPQSSRERCK